MSKVSTTRALVAERMAKIIADIANENHYVRTSPVVQRTFNENADLCYASQVPAIMSWLTKMCDDMMAARSTIDATLLVELLEADEPMLPGLPPAAIEAIPPMLTLEREASEVAALLGDDIEKETGKVILRVPRYRATGYEFIEYMEYLEDKIRADRKRPDAIRVMVRLAQESGVDFSKRFFEELAHAGIEL